MLCCFRMVSLRSEKHLRLRPQSVVSLGGFFVKISDEHPCLFYMKFPPPGANKSPDHLIPDYFIASC